MRFSRFIGVLFFLFFGFLGLSRVALLPPAQAQTPTPSVTESGSLNDNPDLAIRSQDTITQSKYIKGLYVTYYGVGSEVIRTRVFDLVETTELNALVLDIKGDFGLLSYKSNVITATNIGANDAPMISDWPAFKQELEDRDIYAIARIVVFKDDYLARAHPEWAVTTAAGQLWFDREDLPWLEPFHEEVWDYNIALAVEAAERGFDEIQFDYVRFPTDGALSSIAYSQPVDSSEVRSAAISGFLEKAKAALEPYDVKLAADVFGYTTWYPDDFNIGQDLSQMAVHLDVLSPMVYPSTYGAGLPGLPEYNDLPVAYPYEVVYESMMRGMAQVKQTNPDIIVRPWIQDFSDYAFDRRTYTPDEIREQMFAAYDTGGGGWMLWDPRVEYTPEALVTTDVTYPPNEMGEVLILRYQTFGETDQDTQRSLAGFRQDLEQLRAAGFYPINLRDLAVGQSKYSRDLDLLTQEGWPPFQSESLVRQHMNYVPEGKRPVVLTFDGSHVSQYRLLSNGRPDPNSALGVLQTFHNEHPADWPMRATFFVQPEADEMEYQLFGQAEFAGQKLKTLTELGMEVGVYADQQSFDSDKEIRRQLSRQSTLAARLATGDIVSLALPAGDAPTSKTIFRRGAYEDLSYNYQLIAVVNDAVSPSPKSPDFNPYHISRVQATSEAVKTWLEHYRTNPGTYYVAAGLIPDTKPVNN